VRQPPGPRLVPVVQVAPPHPAGPQRHRLRWRRRTRPDGRGRTPEGWTLDRWTPHGRTAGPRTTNPGDRTPDGLDTGRLDSRTGVDTGRTCTPDGWTAGPGGRNRVGGHACWTGTGDRRHGWHPGIADYGEDARPLAAGWRLRRAAAVWASNSPDSSAQGPRRTAWPRPRPSAAGDTPRSSWRLGALLSSDDFGSRVERRAYGQVLWRVQRWGGLRRVLWGLGYGARSGGSGRKRRPDVRKTEGCER
jgi:hypothetical protein